MQYNKYTTTHIYMHIYIYIYSTLANKYNQYQRKKYVTNIFVNIFNKTFVEALAI